MFGGGGGGFLQGAMQTAAGVAAGEMMFQGMESLFHGFEHGGGSGFAGMGGRPEETVVNNYYDDNGGDRGRDDSSRDSGSFYDASDDASRSGLGTSGDQFADTGNDASFGDVSDNSGFDDNLSSDDSSSF